MKKSFTYLILASICLFIHASCKKNVTPDVPDTGAEQPVSDTAKVSTTVYGVVLDENGNPVSSISVQCGLENTVTNNFGVFYFNNIQVSKNNGFVSVKKSGYYSGIKSFITNPGKPNFVKLKLIPKVLTGTINALAGGVIITNGGAAIDFPANAFVTNSGTLYTGSVKVFSKWIDPASSDLVETMPGDLRGITTNGSERLLATYGMVGAELQDASGNQLKLANNIFATINFPIPASLSASAPASIPLWHFDEQTARWREDGKATKAGNTYTGKVNKFSFWNVDVLSTFVTLDLTVVNVTNNTPFSQAIVRITRLDNGTYTDGYTNGSGFISGYVPKNVSLKLDVINNCGTILHTQNIGAFSTNASLGNINITLPSSEFITFSGTIVNCSNAPVSNGFVVLRSTELGSFIANTNGNGNFAITMLKCGAPGTGSFVYQAYDNTNTITQQSIILSGSITGNSIVLGNIRACALPQNLSGVYVAGGERNSNNISTAMLWKDGTGINLTDGSRNAWANSVFATGNDVYVCGHEVNITNQVAFLWKNGTKTQVPGFSVASSIFISGTDVYICGQYEAPIPRGIISKNGVNTYLSNGVNSTLCHSVFVAGNDVYVCGEASNPASGAIVAQLWKNGAVTILSDAGKEASAYDVFVAGIDVYVVGKERNANGKYVAKLWKNGAATNLTDGTKDANANTVFVDGSDIYVGGMENSSTIAGTLKAKVWKNGVAIPYSTLNGDVTDILFKNGSLYATGYGLNTVGGQFAAKTWKDGAVTNLTGGVTLAYGASVFVK
jgi:hypothetical protein